MENERRTHFCEPPGLGSAGCQGGQCALGVRGVTWACCNGCSNWSNATRPRDCGVSTALATPHSNALSVGPEIEDRIVRLRKSLSKAGFDAGADTIAAHLATDPAVPKVSAVSTIWRLLTRRGFVTPQPHKRPRSAWKRFEAAMPNQCWQADVTPRLPTTRCQMRKLTRKQALGVNHVSGHLSGMSRDMTL